MSDLLPPPGSEPGLTPVYITAGDRGAEIVVVDAAFGKVASGVGSLNIQLRPGLYKARFKAGNRSEDHLFEVAGGLMVTVQGTPLQFSSPIPLERTSNNHEYHFYPARELAKAPPTPAAGIGAELLLFVRDSLQKYGSSPATAGPWTNITVRKPDGTVIFNLAEQGSLDSASAYAGAKLAVNPGQYFLESHHPALGNQSIALPMVACAGWCTHVYIDSRDTYSRTATEKQKDWTLYRTADLAGASVVMARIDHGSALDEEMARLTETARQALTLGRGALADDDLRSMIDGKSEFPMLGLYAAHSLLIRPEKDWQRLGLILQNLQYWLVSEHPDCSTLLAACAAKGTAPLPSSRSLWPPVLAATWKIADLEQVALPIGQNRNSLLLQYRLGGTIWNCMQFPNDVTRPYADDGEVALFTNTLDAFRSVAPPPGLESAHPTTDAVASWLLSRQPLLADWKQLATALRSPNPSHTPFQQAVRRLLLDSVADNSGEIDLAHSLASLIRQFQVPPDSANRWLQQLHTEAFAGSLKS
jgi:hypothetical protein